MLKQDYVLRLIEQIARVFQRLLQRLQGGGAGLDEGEIDRALHELTGLNLDLMQTLSLDGLLELLRTGGEIDVVRALAAAELLFLHAEVPGAGGAREVDALRIRALTLYLEVLSSFRHQALADAEGRAESLIEALRDVDLPEATLRGLMRFAEARGRFAQAEDALFELVDRGGDHSRVLDLGRSFYRRLLAAEDGDLEDGGLPRDEVEEGLAELERRASV